MYRIRRCIKSQKCTKRYSSVQVIKEIQIKVTKGGTHKNLKLHPLAQYIVLLFPISYSPSLEEDATAPPLATGLAESRAKSEPFLKSLHIVQPLPPLPLSQEQHVLNRICSISLDHGRKMAGKSEPQPTENHCSENTT